MVVEPAPSMSCSAPATPGSSKLRWGLTWLPCYNGISAARVVTVGWLPLNHRSCTRRWTMMHCTRRVRSEVRPFPGSARQFHPLGYVNDIAVAPADAGKAYAVGGT